MDESTTDSLGISDAQIAYLQNEVSFALFASCCTVLISLQCCLAYDSVLEQQTFVLTIFHMLPLR